MRGRAEVRDCRSSERDDVIRFRRRIQDVRDNLDDFADLVFPDHLAKSDAGAPLFYAYKLAIKLRL